MRRHRFISASLILLLAGCDTGPDPETRGSGGSFPDTSMSSPLGKALTGQLQKTCESGQAVLESTQALLDQTIEPQLLEARKDWLEAHKQYRETALLYRGAGTPLPFWYEQQRDPVDATGLIPGYLDSVPGYPHSGLAHSQMPLTPTFLRQEHQSTDFHYLTLGFHPLGFFLWSDDSIKGSLERLTPSDSTEDNRIAANDRRRTLVRQIATLLAQDLGLLCSDTTRDDLLTALPQLSDNPQTLAVALKKTLKVRLTAISESPGSKDAHGLDPEQAWGEMGFLTGRWTTTWWPLLFGPDRYPEARDALKALAAHLEASTPDEQAVKKALNLTETTIKALSSADRSGNESPRQTAM